MKITKPTFISTNTDGIYVKTDDSKYLDKHDVAIAYSEMIDALIDVFNMIEKDYGNDLPKEHIIIYKALTKAGCTYEH